MELEERDQRILLDLRDYQIGLAITNDIENRGGGYLVLALAQWVATIRKLERET